MSRVRPILGLAGSAILLLSSAAHSILGWRAMGGRLAGTNAPPDLITGLGIGWRFGGVAMLVFGIITARVFVARLRGEALRGEAVSGFPVSLIAVAYLLFAAWAAVATGFDPFFLIFVVPALLLLAAAR